MAGIERGTPDVSIAREMDTPLHRVLLSGLVYARARLTAGPWFNRRGEEPERAAAKRVGVYADVIHRVSLFLAPFRVSSGCSEKSSRRGHGFFGFGPSDRVSSNSSRNRGVAVANFSRCHDASTPKRDQLVDREFGNA